jgi:hypothetical protein
VAAAGRVEEPLNVTVTWDVMVLVEVIELVVTSALVGLVATLDVVSAELMDAVVDEATEEVAEEVP